MAPRQNPRLSPNREQLTLIKAFLKITCVLRDIVSVSNSDSCPAPNFPARLPSQLIDGARAADRQPAAAGLALRRAGERVRPPPGAQQADKRVLHVGVPLEGVADVFDNSLDQHVHLLLTLRHLFLDSDVTWRELFPVEK